MKEEVSLGYLLKTGVLGSLPLGILMGFLAVARVNVVDFNENPVYGLPGFLLAILFTCMAMVPLLVFAYLMSKFGEFLLKIFKKK